MSLPRELPRDEEDVTVCIEQYMAARRLHLSWALFYRELGMLAAAAEHEGHARMIEQRSVEEVTE